MNVCVFDTGSSLRRGKKAATRFGALLFGIALGAGTAHAVDISITQLADIDFGAVSPTAGELVSRVDVCVALSEPGRYAVVATGTGAGNGFAIDDGLRELPVTVRFSDKPNRRGVVLSPGVPLTGQKGKKRKKNGGCNRPTASIEVSVAAGDLAAAAAGQYSGTLSVTVTPE